MKPTFFRPQILQQNVQMDGSINFMTNGDINVYPCPWEDEKQVTGGERVRYRAGIEVDADGRTYRSDNGHRRLKDEYVYVTFKFPKKYGLALTKALYEEEADQILSYLKTRKEETIWK